MTSPLRKIIHIDMDAFYASVEQRDRPELRGKPVAVGGEGERSVVAAASYEARKYGVRSAMASLRAKRLCPDLIFVRGNFESYKKVSRQIRDIFLEYTDLVEPLSLDEAYLDVTEPKAGPHSATLIAQEIRRKIFETTQLTASAGVSYCKFLAKMASDVNKPNGMKVILPDEAAAFIENLPVERFHGIGKATADKMNKMGILYGRDLKRRGQDELMRRFGKVGRYYYDIVRGIDNRPVSPDRVIKSISVENTYHHDLGHLAEMHTALDALAQDLAGRLSKKNNAGRTVTLKIKYPDFQSVTRSKTIERDVCSAEDLASMAKNLLLETEVLDKKARLMGIGVSNLKSEREALFFRWGKQLELEFEWE